MKKLIAILVAMILMLPVVGMACEETAVLVARHETPNVYSDPSYWAVTEDCRIVGIKDVDEFIPRMGVQSTHSQYIAGKLDNGWVRLAGKIQTVTVGECVVGLTLLKNVTITVYPEYAEIAQSVVVNLLGDGTEMSANAIAACAMWWQDDYVSMIFHPSYSDRFEVGYVRFNSGEDRTPLYLAHFGGELRFGLACGWWIPAPEPEPEQTNNNVTATVNAGASAHASSSATAAVNVQNSGTIDNSGDGCWRNNVTVQINLFSIIKQGIKILKECVEQ